ncbi:DUF805 domain-containing protein [Staphylococcus debuckii]|uniref:DUF805 domain-containing protein n=1 Tax=Staphylococcus debuckii TaxID=2044912 RepID=A0ABU9F0C8_9STAP
MEKRVGFGESFVLFWKNYVNFQGRATRPEYWFMTLWSFIIFLPITFIAVIGMSMMIAGSANGSDGLIGIGAFIYFGLIIIVTLIGLAMLLPSIALLFRRFHDTGRSGKIYFFFLGYAIIGYILVIVAIDASDAAAWSIILGVLVWLGYMAFAIYMFVITVLPSEPRDNKYGPVRGSARMQAGDANWRKE